MEGWCARGHPGAAIQAAGLPAGTAGSGGHTRRASQRLVVRDVRGLRTEPERSGSAPARGAWRFRRNATLHRDAAEARLSIPRPGHNHLSVGRRALAAACAGVAACDLARARAAPRRLDVGARAARGCGRRSDRVARVGQRWQTVRNPAVQPGSTDFRYRCGRLGHVVARRPDAGVRIRCQRQLGHLDHTASWRPAGEPYPRPRRPRRVSELVARRESNRIPDGPRRHTGGLRHEPAGRCSTEGCRAGVRHAAVVAGWHRAGVSGSPVFEDRGDCLGGNWSNPAPRVACGRSVGDEPQVVPGWPIPRICRRGRQRHARLAGPAVPIERWPHPPCHRRAPSRA